MLAHGWSHPLSACLRRGVSSLAYRCQRAAVTAVLFGDFQWHLNRQPVRLPGAEVGAAHAAEVVADRVVAVAVRAEQARNAIGRQT